MMKPRILFLTFGLVAVLLASCAPQATPPPTPLLAVTQEVTTQAPESATQPQVTLEAPTVAAAATSRGPNLEATDPASISLASGQLQLVEFFRFT